VPAKVTKLVGLKNGERVSPTNLIIFACTQNGEYSLFCVPARKVHKKIYFQITFKFLIPSAKFNGR
jgi:hypothetical protein